ncbi:MAG: hypothetical protein ACLQU3_27725 [Limisphaerales bacterium]
MRKLMFKALAVFLLSGATTFAGSFTSDFSNPNQPGYTLVPDALNDPYPVVTNSELLFLPNATSVGPLAFLLDDLDNGATIDTITASFQLQLGPYSSTLPADGIAFCFGPDVSGGVPFGEDGPWMGDGGVGVCFVTWNGDGPGIGVNVRVAGDGSLTGGIVPNGYVPMSYSTMVDSAMHNVSIQLKRNGIFNMVWNGQVVFTNLFLPNWSPTYGQFAIGGRTGGSCQEVLINNLDITTTVEPATPAAPTITSQPKSITVNEGSSATFTVGFDGDAPFTFQWTENGNPITDGTDATLTMTEVSYTNNNAKIACTVGNFTSSATSQSATLTVIPDKTPPTVTSVDTDLTFTNVTVVFDKPVSDTALITSNYKVNQGVVISSATRVNESTVTLGTSTMPIGGTFILTINGVQDMAATPNTIAPNTQITFRTYVFSSGSIVHKKYNNCADGFSLANLFTDPRYPNNPDRVDIEATWEYPPNNQYRVAADPVRNYIDTLEGYFVPPTTGDYVFYVCGDDEYYLFLSTDDNPANMQEIAGEPGGWSDQRAWCTNDASPGYHSGNATNWDSATSEYTSTAWPTGVINLTANQRYYMWVMHHDHSWSGGDWFGATYSGPNVAAPVDGDATLLSGGLISYYLDPTGAYITFTEQPQSVTAVEGTSATLSAAATGSSVYGTNVSYQWQVKPNGGTTFGNISGATLASVSTSILGLSDSGAQYQVLATVAPITVTSAVATVTVVADTTPPVVSVGAINGQTAGTVNIGVGFNKTVNDTSGSLQANYSVSSGTITSFTWCSNRFTADSQNPLVTVRKQGALLTVTGFSGSGTVTVKNIADTYGNTLASTNVPITLASNMSWGVVGANQLGGWNAVVPVGPGSFDVYSDGIAEWGNYDETTFVYEQVTGDFDKKLRVEYQDGSSEWGRAGLIVRDVTNFGVDAATQEGSQPGNTPVPPYDGTAGRYQKCHVNPVGACLTGPGTAGNAAWETNRRLDTGGGCTTPITGVNSTPLYPNAWCRIQRKVQTFTMFRSDDGVNWVTLGETTWGVDDTNKLDMPATVYVGPEFSPENGNITEAIDQGTFLAQFRDYGDVVTQPTLSVAKNPDGTFTLTYTGTLYSSTTVNGTYTAVSGAATPFTVNPKATGASPNVFYRAGP